MAAKRKKKKATKRSAAKKKTTKRSAAKKKKTTKRKAPKKKAVRKDNAIATATKALAEAQRELIGLKDEDREEQLEYIKELRQELIQACKDFGSKKK